MTTMAMAIIDGDGNAMIRYAGHEVPAYQPQKALELFNGYLDGSIFDTAEAETGDTNGTSSLSIIYYIVFVCIHAHYLPKVCLGLLCIDIDPRLLNIFHSFNLFHILSFSTSDYESSSFYL